MTYGEEQIREQQKLQQEFLALETAVKNYFTKEALMRYGALKTAHPEAAIKTIASIAQLVQSGHITEKITDQELKAYLMQIQQKKTFTLKR